MQPYEQRSNNINACNDYACDCTNVYTWYVGVPASHSPSGSVLRTLPDRSATQPYQFKKRSGNIDCFTRARRLGKGANRPKEGSGLKLQKNETPVGGKSKNGLPLRQKSGEKIPRQNCGQCGDRAATHGALSKVQVASNAVATA